MDAPTRNRLTIPPHLISRRGLLRLAGASALGCASLNLVGLGRANAAAPWSHGIAMHGDMKYAADFAHFDYVNPNAPKGGKVRLAAIGGFDSLNPFILKGEAASNVGLIYDTLMQGAEDEPFSMYGHLAESLQVPDDRSWVSFRLRDGVHWHDGTPLTAADVVFTFKLLMDQGAPSLKYYYAGVADVIALSEREVKFTFHPGVNQELPLILGQLSILPKHYWADKEFNKTSLEPPLGSGAYKITEVDAGRSVTFERVAEYWGDASPAFRGTHNFGSIRFDYYRDATVALEAFKAGAFDFRAENSSKAWATGYKFPAVKEGRVQMAEVPHERSAGMQAFAYNTRRDLFKDVRVRQALAYAFDFEWCNENLFYGQYSRTRSFFENSELAARELPSDAELKLLAPFRAQLPEAVFTESYEPPKTHGGGSIRANLSLGSRLLTQAGWVIKDGKRVNAATGQELSFEVLLISPLFERIVLSFAKNLERLGVEIKIRTVDSAQYRQRLDTFDYDMIVANWGQSLSPGNEQRTFWSSNAADQEGSRNYVGIKDPVVDALVEALIAAEDRKALVTACRALDRVLQWNHYVIPQWHLAYDRIAYWDQFGQPETVPTKGVQFFSWWVNPAKADTLGRKG